MSLKVLVLDVSNTTLKSDLTLQPGIEDFLSFCREKDLKIAFVTNTPAYKRIIPRQNIEHDIIVTPDEVGKKKPSPDYITFIEKQLKIPREKFIYIGDRDRTDAFCASNAKVLYFSATWANKSPNYGITVSSPQVVKKLIVKYLLKEDYWYWKLDTTDQRDRNIKVYAMLDCTSRIKDYAVEALKWGVLKYRFFFMFHLVASLYFSRIYKEIDYWTNYPSHNVGDSLNPTMDSIMRMFTKEVNKKHLNLFQRHTESRNSGASRRRGQRVGFENQLNTINVNPSLKRKISGARVLVLDDFTTEGNSFECARNLLFEAGASNVICVSIGKYGNKYNMVTTKSKFNPFAPINSSEVRCEKTTLRNAEFNNDITPVLEESFDI